MTHRTRNTAIALTSGLVLVAVTLAPGVARAGSKADCRVSSVEATKAGSGEVPANLAFMKDELESPAFAAFKGFKLVDNKRVAVEVGAGAATTRIKPKHTIKLELLSADKRLKLHANIAGAKPLVDLDYNIENKGLMLFPVPRGDGAIIFAIQCAKAS